MTKKARGGNNYVALLALVFILAAPPASASEPMGPIEIQLRLLDVTPGHGPDSAVARIEVKLQARIFASEPLLDVKRADGSPWTTKGGRLSTRNLHWRKSVEPQEGSESHISHGFVDEILTTIEVPLEGRAVHEVVVTASAASPGGILTTENVVLVPFGASLPLPADDGTVSEFPAVPSREVRP